MRVTELAVMKATVTLIATDCASCGVIFAITEEFRNERKENGDRFYCPNGHHLVYGGGALEKAEKEAEELRKKLQLRSDMYHKERENRQAVERSLVTTKGHLTRVKKRIHAGVCPHCNRHFENMQRHMASKHKEHIDGD